MNATINAMQQVLQAHFGGGAFHHKPKQEKHMYELWETHEHDGCIEKVAIISTFTDLKSAVAAAVACRRPGIEIWSGYWRSHIRNSDGSWSCENLKHLNRS